MNNTKDINNPETQKRIKQNVEALRDFIRGDKTAIKRYTGWGGLRNALYNRAIFCQLKFDCGLTDEEITSIKNTLSSAYYTPAPLVNGVWQILGNILTTAPVNVLEPALGAGIFIDKMPAHWRQQASIEGVEIDTLTSRMAAAYFEDINVHCMPFQHYQNEHEFDVVIGNPPYGQDKVIDKHHSDLNDYCIHHYFVAKSLRMLKVGGYLAMILPSYFLDNAKAHTRDIVAADGGQLVASWRFPSDMFDNAKVTIDCVIIQRTDKPVSANWLNVGAIAVDGHRERINQYYIDKPNHVLGELVRVPMYQRMGIECRRTFDTVAKWQEQIAALKSNVNTRLEKLNLAIADYERHIDALLEKKEVLIKARQDYATALNQIKTLLNK